MMRVALLRYPRLSLELAVGGSALVCAALIAWQPLPVAAGLLLMAVALLGALINPTVGLCLTVATVLVQELIPLPLGLSVTHVVGAIALGTWLLAGLGRRTIRIETIGLVPWALFLLALLLAASMTPFNAVDSLKQVVRWLLAFLVFVVTAATVRTPRRAGWLVAAILAAGVVESSVGLWQFVHRAGPFGIGAAVRAYGTIGKPNTFAGFLGMIWPLGLALGLALLGRWWRQRTEIRWLLAGLAAGGAGLVCLAGIGVSFSRGAWIGVLAGLAAMAGLAAGRRAVPVLLAGALGLVALLAAPNLLPAAIGDRVASITSNLRIFDAARVTVTDANFAVVERMAHWQAGARMFLAHPLVGVGPDNFNRAYPLFYVGRWAQSQGHAHNYYIHIAAEAGILGLLSYLVLIGAMAWMGWRAVQQTRGTLWQAVAIGGCGIIAAVQVHNVFENLHVLNFGIHLSAVWGLLAVLNLEHGWRTEPIL